MLGNVSPLLNIKADTDLDSPIDVFPEFPIEIILESKFSPRIADRIPQFGETPIHDTKKEEGEKTAYQKPSRELARSVPIVFPAPRASPLHDTYPQERTPKSERNKVFVSTSLWSNSHRELQSPMQTNAKLFAPQSKLHKSQHRQAASTQTTKINNIIFKAEAYLLKNDIESAFEWLADAVDQGVSHADVFYLFGEVSRLKGVTLQAERFLLKALSFQMHSSHVYCSLGLLYMNSRNYGKAITFLKEFIKKQETAEGYFLLGKVLAEVRQLEESIEAFSKAIVMNPRKTELYLYRGQAHEAKGSRSQAQLDYSTALSLDTKCLVPYYAKFKESQKQNNLKEAERIRQFLLRIKQAMHNY